MWTKAYINLIKGERSFGHLLLLALRLYWGVLLIQTGFGKLSDMEKVINYFTSLNIPLPHISAYISAFTEFLGGISLVLGLLTPLSTLLLTINFVVAYATAHSVSSLESIVSQQPFPYLLTSLIVLSFGPGFFSVDAWLEKKFTKNG